MGSGCLEYIAPYLSVWQLEGGLAKQEPGLYAVIQKGLCLSPEFICFTKSCVYTRVNPGICALHGVRALGMNAR